MFEEQRRSPLPAVYAVRHAFHYGRRTFSRRYSADLLRPLITTQVQTRSAFKDRAWSHRRRGITRLRQMGLIAPPSSTTIRALASGASRVVVDCVITALLRVIGDEMSRRKECRRCAIFGRTYFASRSVALSSRSSPSEVNATKTLRTQVRQCDAVLSRICAAFFTFFVPRIYVEGQNFALIVDSM